MLKMIVGIVGLCAAALAAEPDYIRERDAATAMKDEEAFAALLALADGPFSAAQKSDALELASTRALALGRHDRAMELAKRIATPAISKAAQIRVLAAQRQWNLLIAQFRDEAIDTWWPDYLNGEAYFARGRAFAATGDGARAVVDLRKAADVIRYDDNSKGLALIALGNAYRSLLKDDTQALAAYRETYTIKASAKHCEAAMGAAEILARRNKLDDALADLATVDPAKLDRGIWSASLLAARADVLAKQGKKLQATALYREALRMTHLHPSQRAAYEKALTNLDVRP